MSSLSTCLRSIAATIFLLVFIVPRAAQAQELICFPTCNEVDSKMITLVVGDADASLGDEPLGFTIVSDNPAGLNWGIFDADADPSTALSWDTAPGGEPVPMRSKYTLYADPTLSGDITGLTEVVSIFSDDLGAVDNGWYDIFTAHSPAALNGGVYNYLLHTSHVELNTNGQNSFKVRADAAIALSGNQTMAFQGALYGNTLLTVFPNAGIGDFTTSTYDALWEFNLLVTAPPGSQVTEFVIFDGDLDHGDGIVSNDTDDPDTVGIPDFNTSSFAVNEGAVGVGSPPDNNNIVPPLSFGDAVTYTVTDPQGNTFVNSNPSGDREWEKFEIRTNDHAEGCDSTVADYCVDRLSAGVWTVNILGMDIANTNFYRSRYISFPPIDFSGVGNYVWIDENGDGIQDAGEPGIAGVTVNLFDINGNLVGQAVTDSNGGYFIKVALPGSYSVQVDETTLPFGLTQTQLANQGADFGNQESPYSVALSSGEQNLTADFGYNWGDSENNTGNGAIGDTVWIDMDGNGVQNGSEPGINGVELTIYSDSDGNGIIEPGVDDPFFAAIDHNGDTGTGTTLTNADGLYVFDELPPGAYVVVVTNNIPAGHTQTGDPDQYDGTGIVVFDNRNTQPVVIEPGDAYINVDFGYQPDAGTLTNSIGDTIFLDSNADGTEDAGEPGIKGVTVELQDSTGNSVAATITNETGFYLFEGLPDGEYTVVVTDSQGLLLNLAQSADPDSMLDGQSTTSVAGGSSDLIRDFGYVPFGHESGDGLVGDTVFLDRNGNGLPDSGEGVSGVTVDLYDPTGVVLIDQTVTDFNGLYYFGGLDPVGTYVIRVNTSTLPSGITNSVDPDGGNDSESSISLASDPDGTNDGINLDQDFGYVADTSGSIGDLVWLDSNADGTNDGVAGADGVPGTEDDEPGFEGVTLDLYLDWNGDGLLQSSDPKLASLETDANGAYLFAGLPAGDYIVDVVDEIGVLSGYWHTLGAADTNDDSQADPYAVNLVSGGSVVTADFGYQKALSALGDRVWFDVDADGIQESGEPGLSGVEINLTIDYSDGTQTILTTITDGNGLYTFANLLADEDYNGNGVDDPIFTIDVVAPTGLLPSPIDQGGDDSLDSDDPNGELGDPFPGQPDNSNDFGFYDTGSISGNVSEDTDRDGTIDGPLTGVTIELFEDFDRNGIPDSPVAIDSTTTDADGNYEFLDVSTGSYLVVETDPNGYESLSDGDATVVGDDDFPPANDPTDDNIIPVTITVDSVALLAEDDDGNNFVDSPLLAGLGDTVWYDHNTNGVQDAGENGIPNVTVNLISGGSVIDTTVTDGTGFYEFTGIVASTYTVEVDPASFTTALEQTHDFDDPVTTNPVTPNAATVTLSPGETNNDIDFGYRPLGTIGDTVWNDVNANGVQDGAEVGIEGVDVTLTGSVNDSATTNASGFYEFTNLPAGVYTVTVSGTPLDGLQQTHDLDDPVTTSPATPDTANVELVLSASEDSIVSRDDVDFGYREQGVISGTVTEDTDGDDVGDQAQEGVTVELYADTDGDGNPDGTAIDTTTTGVDGSYSFTDVPAGDYVVIEVTPTGLADVSDQDSTPDGDSLDGDTTVDDQIAVTLDVGETDDGNDFVDENQGSISGTVTEDTTGDGLGDTAQEGVTVELYTDTDGDGNPDGAAIDSTTTAADGSYSFDTVAPGQYVVVEVQPAGLADVSDDDATPEDTSPADSGTAVDNQIPATVEPGEADADNNFVDVNQGGISGNVSEDQDGNGTDPNVPIQGVTIELFADTDADGQPDGAAIETTTTDSSGNYSFTDLMPGDYVVVETQPANLDSVSDQDTTPDGDAFDGDTTVDDQIAVTLVSGESDDGNDFVEENRGTISGSVEEDTNGDGAGDQGIVTTVELYADTNGDGQPDTLVDSTTTAADGSYSFDVSPGDYVVVEVQPAGLVDVSDQDTAPDGDAFDGDTTVDNQVAVTVDPGEDDAGNDFVDENQGSISGNVLLDTNGDGAGDTPQSGVTVELYVDSDGDGNADGAAIDSTTSAADGSYAFDPVSPGQYVVVEVTPAGLIDVSDDDASPEDSAPADSGTPVDDQIPVTVEPGEADDDNNFVDVDQGGIAGNVGEDTTGDGAADTAISGVVIELFADTDGDGQPDGGAIATTTTDTNGDYSFPGVMPGNYVVVQTQPVGLVSIFDEDQNGDSDPFDGDTTVDNQIAVTVVSGELDDGNNFGEQALASIEGQVLVDNDGNGTGDTGLGGVEITLQDSGGATVDTTTTAADGSYSFTDLVPGDYTVVETQPANYVSVSDQDQQPDGDPQDANVTVDDQIGALLLPGETDAGNDFVERLDNICIPKPSDSNSNGNDYSIWINGEYFSADANNTYMVDNAAGTARYQGSVTSNSNGTTHSVDILFSGRTTDAPAGSPKLPSFPVDTSDWVYYTEISGNVGPYTLSRRGPAYQVGYGANMNDTGFGSSGWMYFTDGSTTLNGDINIRLVDCSPRIDIRKQAEGADSRTFNPGDTVEFEIVVTNTGEFDLTNVVVDDPITPSCDRTIGSLAIGESISYTCSVTLDNTSPTPETKMWLDNFSPAYSYSGNDGDTNFLGNWVENDPQGGGASSGRVLVGSNNKMWMNNYNYPGGSSFKPSAQRAVDLSGMDTATLSFDWITHAGVDSNDAVALEVSTNGGSSFTQIAKFWGARTSTKQESYDVSTYISSNTVFRFRVTDYYGGADETFKVDNFKIEASGSAGQEGFINVANVSGLGDGVTVTDSDPSEVIIEGPVVCEECVNGQSQITLKVSNWSSNRDQYETVRVREGGLGGTLLFQGQVANGGTFTFDVNNPGTTIVVTVQGNSHPSEYVKGTFVTDCDLQIGHTSGNSYITFKVNGLVGDGQTGDCDPGDPSNTLDIRVSQGSDDAEQRADGTMYLNSTDLELVYDSSNQHVGIRFQGVNVPEGATITNAYIEFQADETNSGATSVTIKGHDTDNAATFTSSSSNISSRTLTSASVAWNNIATWSTIGAKHQTSDLTSIVQEITDRAGWSSGNSIAFIITGSGERTAESYEGDSAGAPKLHIEFSTENTGGNPDPEPPVEAQTTTLVNAYAGQCLDNLGSDLNSPVYKRSCTGVVNQKWEFRAVGSKYELVNADSQLCLDVSGGSTLDNAAVSQYQCHQGSNQLWELIPYGSEFMLKASSGKCLEVVSTGSAYQYTCDGFVGQRWNLTPPE